ncbi:MAG: UDP-forming cellulose synthase catalytic subunit [Phenylobacterium sp.]|uniref:UDP-forming cellulose synthase catalytic subunit n=1 Tax=Phenylobacterium sp. TaxID=1871053 RepID=UPI00271E9F82|nr:UDP-forming cellulose synthase catalytic subunit [Phenylobacterium sp.]MDO8410065.1 UDP-forming cellulose synthase catalytic subunit [Phenylobacterium sp.]
MNVARGIFLGAALIIGPLAMGAAIFTPLPLQGQIIFGIATLVAALILSRNASRGATIALCLISLAISTRYMVWRTTETLDFLNPLGAVLGIGLYLAEVYAWLILVLGYVQTTWPLRRPVRALGGGPADWPSIDVMIPTYNESLQIVRDTVLAALAMDYPPERFTVHLLDDGRRPEFKAFAESVGVNYVTRPDNLHAKAGNLNNALKQTRADLVCIFDADHIPTRAFLQMTAGWFQEDARLALLQTPHHFYSPDPVQRNLVTMKDVPDEGALFYGAVQPGNDFWNAAFFCGSCALIRRAALDETNGFAGETVTEDAHTALKLQRLGWNTAYLDIRLASGLATERLALHIGQRARWARGMLQIFRVDNPLFGPGLSLGQRLCYANAMLHFMFPLPRVVFLTSPLAFLLLGQNVIQAAASMIAAYAAPHLILSIGVANRIQGKDRRAFWGEVYESLLAFHLIKPTLQTLIDPRRGKFNVTDKGGILERAYFDIRLMWPHLLAASLLIAGVAMGFGKLAWPDRYEVNLGTLLLNTTWSAFSLLILLVALAVGRETRQLRAFVRVGAQLPVRLTLRGGEVVETTTSEVSMGGFSAPAVGDAVTAESLARTEILCGDRWVNLPTKVVGPPGPTLRAQFLDIPLDQRRELVAAVMGRADAWQPASKPPPANPFAALLSILQASLSLFHRGGHRQPGPAPQRPLRRARSTGAVVALAACLGVTMQASEAKAQDASAPALAAQPMAATPGPGAQTLRLTLRDLGVDQPLRLVSVDGQAGIPFRLGADEVVTGARLTLAYAHSPALLEDLSHLTVLINDEVVATAPLAASTAGGARLSLELNPALFLVENRLNLRFAGHYTRDCEDPLHSSLWAVISNASVLELDIERLPAPPNLARFPAPFFDNADRRLELPFVFVGAPGRQAIQAAGALASYFGLQASYRGFRFPVLIDQLPAGDGVVFALANSGALGLELPPINGPTVAVIANPLDTSRRLLLVLGRDPMELRQAALTLSLGAPGLSGASASLGPPTVPTRAAYDAPRWITTERPVKLGEIMDPALLHADGLPPGPVRASFRLPPDLLFWPQSAAPLRLRYRYPMGPWIDRSASRLDVSVNGQYLRSLRLNQAAEAAGWRHRLLTPFVRNETTISLPAYNLFGSNELQFYFDLKARKTGACEGQLPTNVRSGIDPDTELDLTGAHHLTSLPNLAYFASAGFPFTRMADLDQTVVLLSARPSPAELGAYLHLMARFGDATGAPVTRVHLASPDDVETLRNRDILMIGPLSLLAENADLSAAAPIEMGQGRLTLRVQDWARRLFSTWGTFIGRDDADSRQRAASLLVESGPFSGLMSFGSPFGQGRVVVALLSDRPEQILAIAQGLDDSEVNARVAGDLVVGTGEGLNAFKVGATFQAGDMAWGYRIFWWLSRYPVLMALGLVLAAIIVSVPLTFAMRRHERRRLGAMADQ